MSILLASLHVLGTKSMLTGALLLCIAWGTIIVWAVLRNHGPYEDQGADYTSLALGGWPIPLLLASVVFFALSITTGFLAARIVTLAFALLAAGFCVRSLWGRISWRDSVPALIYILLVFLRLGFIDGILLPPYFDSAWHYGLIRSIAEMEHGGTLSWPVNGYYHMGYHLLISGLVSVTGGTPTDVMLVGGQLILAALPMPLYFAVRRITGSQAAGAFSVVLAGVGWSMPAHAANWGKYPALLGLLVIEFTVFVSLIKQGRNIRTAAVVAAEIIHTRALILLTLAAFGWLFSRFKPYLLGGVAALFLLIEVALVSMRPVASAAIQPYVGLATVISGMLSVLAWRNFPKPVCISLFAMDAMLAAMFIPVLPGLTLLDRPLVQMVLFIPLAFLAGLGAACLPKKLILLLSAIIVVISFSTLSFGPSPCCQLAGADDVAAIDWIKRNLPKDAVIGIASADVTVTSTQNLMQGTGTDAGIWIEPMTERRTVLVPYASDLGNSEIRRALCARGVTHLYVGGQAMSFHLEATVPYHIVFSLPRAQVVEVGPCSN